MNSNRTTRSCLRARLGVLSSVFLLLSGLSSSATASDDRPNVILFVADDLGWADPGFRGSRIETPTLDSLARDGLEFERFYGSVDGGPHTRGSRRMVTLARRP